MTARRFEVFYITAGNRNSLLDTVLK